MPLARRGFGEILSRTRHNARGVGSDELDLRRGQGAGKRRRMTKPSPFQWFKTSPKIIRRAVMLSIRFPPSQRNRFGPMFVAVHAFGHEPLHSGTQPRRQTARQGQPRMVRRVRLRPAPPPCYAHKPLKVLQYSVQRLVGQCLDADRAHRLGHRVVPRHQHVDLTELRDGRLGLLLRRPIVFTHRAQCPRGADRRRR